MNIEHWLLTSLAAIVIGLLTRVIQDWVSGKGGVKEREEFKEAIAKLDKTMALLTLKLEAIPTQHVSLSAHQEFVATTERRLALLEVKHHNT